ncbi:MAG: hypothetical protein ACD_3C00006G0008 [uncultured bacterium (gcode 4)]|uniref:Uncharacterized protein n=1 Tax=uncultured bacterium (gcode 4) TaxID=1234023 RepID=K2FCL7_9BACT|nr:MAG: hypothetical protein ACD_3C00006G0008 [uncultured bacterium (gcode 4)]
MSNSENIICKRADQKCIDAREMFNNKKLFDDFIKNNPNFTDLENVHIGEIEWPNDKKASKKRQISLKG